MWFLCYCLQRALFQKTSNSPFGVVWRCCSRSCWCAPLTACGCLSISGSIHGSRAKKSNPTRQLAAQFGANFSNRLALPELLPILRGAEGAAVHTVNIEIPVQMIDFMLKDSRIPSGSLDRF